VITVTILIQALNLRVKINLESGFEITTFAVTDGH